MKICYTRAHGEIIIEGDRCEACDTIDDLREQIKELEAELEEAVRNAKE